MMTATLLALLAAGLFAAATALQHRSAGLVETEGDGGGARFMADSLRHPLWLLGALADIGGFALHALALHFGPLTLVQPLLVTSLVFALPLRQLIERRRPRRRELLLAGALTAGLAVFLLAATPGPGSSGPPDLGPTVGAIVAVALGMAAFTVVGRRAHAERSAALLGVGAGLGFAAVAGLLKGVLGQLHHGVVSVLTSWPLYLLIVVGVLGLVLNQLAFRAAPLRASLATINTTDPVASALIGVAVFDEQFRRSMPALGAEVGGMVLVIVAIVGLTRGDHGAETEPVTAA